MARRAAGLSEQPWGGEEEILDCHGPSLGIVLVNVPLLVEINELQQQTVQSVASSHLHVHGYKKGQKKQHPANKGDHLGFTQFAAVEFDGSLVLELDDGDCGTGHHHRHGQQEQAVQELVPWGAVGKFPGPSAELFVPLVLVLAQFAAWWLARLLVKNLQPALREYMTQLRAPCIPTVRQRFASCL